MACCRTIIGALGKKLKIIQFGFDPTATAYAAWDALSESWVEFEDVFDTDNGNGKVVHFSVVNTNATGTTKKGIQALLFSSKPASTVVGQNDAESLTVADSKLLCGICSVVTADYIDTLKSAIAEKTASDWLPLVFNTSTDDKKSLWVKLVVTEGATFTAAGWLTVTIVIECF